MNKFMMLMAVMICCTAGAAETWLEHIDDKNKSSEINNRWHADGGQMNLLFFYDMLKSHGIEVKGTGKYDINNWSANDFIMPIKDIGGLSLKVPYGNLIGVDKGVLSLSGAFQWSYHGQSINFNGLSLKPSKKIHKQGDIVAFEMVNDQGEAYFYLDHIHATLDKRNFFLKLENMDVSISPKLAKILGNEKLAGLVIAQAHIKSNLTLPLDGYVDISEVKGSACSGSERLWPGEARPSDGMPAEADVALIGMDAQQQRNLGNGFVVVTPSARLKNVGTLDDADVAWYTKFSGTFNPYSNAQHPFLVWNMYREIDNRFEQIGVSGVKHAFLTINSLCDIHCGSSHILYPGCEDIYGVSNNDSGNALGPRDEITAFSGLWEEQGSFFDQDGNGSQDNSSNGTDENRMVVADADLGQANVNYYISSWYVIRDDINIFNTMGYKQFNVTGSAGNWSLSPSTALNNGPASDQYVSPDSFDLNGGTASQRILQSGEGHLTVAVKVVDLGGGLYRYNYMVENHDYDPKVQTISLPLNDLSQLSNVVFVDTDKDSGNDWVVTHGNNSLTLQAPVDNEIDWGTLYSFSFTTDAAPKAGDVTLTGLENAGTEFVSSVLIPDSNDLIFENGFENMN